LFSSFLGQVEPQALGPRLKFHLVGEGYEEHLGVRTGEVWRWWVWLLYFRTSRPQRTRPQTWTEARSWGRSRHRDRVTAETEIPREKMRRERHIASHRDLLLRPGALQTPSSSHTHIPLSPSPTHSQDVHTDTHITHAP
jgi:hypothetical protein